jgi:hypothetical protein
MQQRINNLYNQYTYALLTRGVFKKNGANNSQHVSRFNFCLLTELKAWQFIQLQSSMAFYSLLL